MSKPKAYLRWSPAIVADALTVVFVAIANDPPTTTVTSITRMGRGFTDFDQVSASVAHLLDGWSGSGCLHLRHNGQNPKKIVSARGRVGRGGRGREMLCPKPTAYLSGSGQPPFPTTCVNNSLPVRRVGVVYPEHVEQFNAVGVPVLVDEN